MLGVEKINRKCFSTNGTAAAIPVSIAGPSLSAKDMDAFRTSPDSFLFVSCKAVPSILAPNFERAAVVAEVWRGWKLFIGSAPIKLCAYGSCSLSDVRRGI